jgi:[ribosomal protein S5]-alanine N-acetyltransferase
LIPNTAAAAQTARRSTVYRTAGFGRCAMALRDGGELVGDCGLAPTSVEGVPEVELGWIVARAQWGKGFATEAGAAWRDYAFERAGLERIVSMIGERNTASRRVAEKLGATIERTAIWGGAPMLMYAYRRRKPWPNGFAVRPRSTRRTRRA